MKFLQKEFLFFIFLALFLILFKPSNIKEYLTYIDYPTIFTLFSLMILTTAIKETHYLEIIAKKILLKTNTERKLALTFVFFALFLSMFLTNDIALFILIPLILALKNFIKNDISKLLIFEAIAVNSGSLLTPIGNPQNIYLFHLMNTSFLEFSYKMLPLFLELTIILLIFIYFSFPSKKIKIIEKEITPSPKNFYLSIALMIIFLVLFNLHKSFYAFIIITTFYLVFNRKIFRQIDYFLIATFILMFIDFKILGKSQPISSLISNLNSKEIFFLSTALSQIISNVPATIFIAQFSHKYLDIAYGVNIAGNGTLISSMANLIALRFYKDSKIYLQFHKYSIPFFIISFVIFILIKYT